MSAFSFMFRPAWLAAVNFGYVLALILAVGGACCASRGQRALGAVMILAALAWPAKAAAAVWATLHGVPGASAGVLAWLPFAGYLPMWAAVGVGLVAAGSGRVRRP